MAGRLLARPFRAEEQAVVAKSLAGLKAFYAANPKDAQALIAVGEIEARRGPETGNAGRVDHARQPTDEPG